MNIHRSVVSLLSIILCGFILEIHNFKGKIFYGGGSLTGTIDCLKLVIAT